ncbi:hypothetical protein V6N13_084309 [Hibiscus sabdariffa]|uniref:Uncharacterized protein n=1 Tax=Hibiscus sabdariffa TaxID=183260 RepID=A0ABR2T171_9ROSI
MASFTLLSVEKNKGKERKKTPPTFVTGHWENTIQEEPISSNNSAPTPPEWHFCKSHGTRHPSDHTGLFRDALTGRLLTSTREVLVTAMAQFPATIFLPHT